MDILQMIKQSPDIPLHYLSTMILGCLAAAADTRTSEGWILVLSFAASIFSSLFEILPEFIGRFVMMNSAARYWSGISLTSGVTIPFLCGYSWCFLWWILLFVCGTQPNDTLIPQAEMGENDLWLFYFTALAYRNFRLSWLLIPFKMIPILFAFIITLNLFGQTSIGRNVLLGMPDYFPTIMAVLRYSNLRYIIINSYEYIVNATMTWERRPSQLEKKGLPKYVYKKLAPGEIRLLRIERRIPFILPRLSLCITQIDSEAISYEAVSYRWGGESIEVEIDKQRLLIPKQIDRLLRFHQSIFGSQYLWVDSICINQDDLAEKTVQISMMRQVYEKATRVLVWMDRRITHFSNNQLRTVLQYLELSILAGDDTILHFGSIYGRGNQGLPFEIVRDFFGHPWFQRVWIIQEVASAKSVDFLYGTVRISFSCVETASIAAFVKYQQLFGQLIDSIGETGSASQEFVSRIARDKPSTVVISDLRKKIMEKNPVPLAIALYETINFQAKDQKDKIFAIAGITQEARNPMVKSILDYSRDLKDVLNLTARYILTTPDWDILLYSSGRGYTSYWSESIRDSLPSWVPQWHPEELHGRRVSADDIAKRKVPKESQRKYVAPIPHNPTSILVQVVQLDIISRVGPGTGRPKTYDLPKGAFTSNQYHPRHMEDYLTYSMYPIREWFKDWYLNSRDMARKYSAAAKNGEEAADEEFWELCMNESADQEPEYLSRSREIWEMALVLDSDEFWHMLRERKPYQTLAAELPGVLQGNFAKAVSGTALGITDLGKMALVPPLCKEGDLICYIKGTLVPFVLRKQKNDYILMGICYVHGCADVPTIESGWGNAEIM